MKKIDFNIRVKCLIIHMRYANIMMQFITPRVPIFRQLCIDAYQIHIQNSLNLLEVYGVEVGRKVNILHLFPNPVRVIHRLVHTCGIRFNDKEQIEGKLKATSSGCQRKGR